MSMMSWLKAQTAQLTEGLKDFADQLQEDVPEVRREAEESARAFREKLEAQQLAQQMASLSHAGAERLSEQVGRVGGGVKKMSHAVGTDPAGVLSRGVETLKKAADNTDSLLAELLGSSSTPAAPAAAGRGVQAANSAATRLEERVRAMQSDETVFTAPPADAEAFSRWCATFELLEHTAEIEALLKGKPALRATHAALVPSRVTYKEFWQRYFFGVRSLQLQEQRRAALLKRAAAPPSQKSLSSWDADFEDFGTPADSPAPKQGQASAKAAASSGKPLVKTPREPAANATRPSPPPVAAATSSPAAPTPPPAPPLHAITPSSQHSSPLPPSEATASDAKAPPPSDVPPPPQHRSAPQEPRETSPPPQDPSPPPQESSAPLQDPSPPPQQPSAPPREPSPPPQKPAPPPQEPSPPQQKPAPPPQEPSPPPQKPSPPPRDPSPPPPNPSPPPRDPSPPPPNPSPPPRDPSPPPPNASPPPRDPSPPPRDPSPPPRDPSPPPQDPSPPPQAPSSASKPNEASRSAASAPAAEKLPVETSSHTAAAPSGRVRQAAARREEGGSVGANGGAASSSESTSEEFSMIGSEYDDEAVSLVSSEDPAPTASQGQSSQHTAADASQKPCAALVPPSLAEDDDDWGDWE